MSTLEIRKLQTRHVGPVNLTIKGGSIVCISGESGSGKSILLRAIADMIPHSGDACLDDQCASGMCAPDWRKSVGLVPAETEWWYETIAEHFTEKDDALLGQTGFNTSTWDWSVARCSTGEKQRLGLLRCLTNKPRALLLDEPTGSLDPDNTRRVEALIKDYASRHAVPVIWVSHSYEQIQRIADGHFKIKNGQLERQ